MIAEHAHRVAEKKAPEQGPKGGKNQGLYIVLGIIFLIAVVVGFMIYSNNMKYNPVVYNNYKFERFEGDKWMTQMLIKGQLYNIPFYYNPNETLDVITDRTTVELIRLMMDNPNNTIYITVNPEESSKIVIAGVEYARILGKSYDIYNLNVKSGVSKQTNVTIDSPVITCRNQTKDTVVIYQYVGTKNEIRRQNYCILLESKNINESIRVADAFAFNLLDIIR